MAHGVKTKIPGLFRLADGSGFVIDKIVHGRRIFRRLRCIPQQLAEEIIAKLTVEVTEQAYFPERGSRSLKVGAALAAYWNEQLQHKRSARDARYLFPPLNKEFGGRQVSSLNVAAIKVYQQKRLASLSRYKRPISPRTVNMECEILDTALNWAAKNRRIPENPIKGYPRVRQAAPPMVVLDQAIEDGPEWRSLYAAADVGIRPILLCLYETGMRPAEAFLLRWEWVERLDASHWVINYPSELEKTGAVRRIPVSPKLLEVLMPMSKDSGLVFPSAIGAVRVDIQKQFRKALARAGKVYNEQSKLWEKAPGGVTLEGKDLTVYALRRTRISVWDEIDPYACRFVVGHAASDVHQKHYLRFSDERLFKLVGVEFNASLRLKLVTAA